MSDRDEEVRSVIDTSQRMRKWRERQRQRLGGLVQIVVWVRSEHENALRTIFEKLADPDWIGEAYRDAVAPWLKRNRPPARVYEGIATSSELDRPLLDDGARLLPIGGRVFGNDDTIVELTPLQAADLDCRIKVALEKVHEAFIRDHDLNGRIRDTTGVIAQEYARYLHGTKPSLREYDLYRPMGKDFWANERAIAGRVLTSNAGVLEDRGDGAVTFAYAGLHRFPSRCLVVTTLSHPEFQLFPNQPLVAIVKLNNCGSPPAVLFDDLANRIRDELLPTIPADKIVWYDAGRYEFEPFPSLHITRVMFEHDGKKYQNPVWIRDEECSKDFYRLVRNKLEAYEGRNPSPIEETQLDFLE